MSRGILDTSTLILLSRLLETDPLPAEPLITARVYDAMIAANAISNDLALHTCQPRDFDGIAELTVIAVPHPDLEPRSAGFAGQWSGVTKWSISTDDVPVPEGE